MKPFIIENMDELNKKNHEKIPKFGQTSRLSIDGHPGAYRCPPFER